jgi:hypothetical protein
MRRVVLAVFVLSVLGFSALAYLEQRGKLPPPLAHAYGTVVSLASSASEAFSASPDDSGSRSGPAPTTDASDAAPVNVRRTTQAAPLSSAQLGAPLVNGKFVTACGAPDDMKVVVKVTVKMGRPIDVSVKSDPANSAVASCVERATREMQWDVSPKTQHATVTY